jgi:predicted enzyme related to lactoylglutathione lyase
MPRVIHFEIPADNPERAVDFYRKVFGWGFQKWGGPQEYWLASTGPDTQPGINGGLLRRQHPGAGTCNTLDVPSVDQAVASVAQHGGKNVMPKTAIPGVGYLAYCSDTEGNVFGLMQADKDAK